MTLIPFAEFAPDRSPFDANYSDVLENCLPLATGYGPFPSFEPLSDPLPSRPMGSYLAYVSNGNYRLFAGTATALYLFDGTTLGWTNVSKKGADIVTNGVFAADTDWTKDAGWTISGGAAHATTVANGNGLSQSEVLTAGVVYKITFTVSNFSAGAVKPIFTGGTQVDGDNVAANGTSVQYLTAVSGNNAFELQAVGTTTLDIDNVIIEPLTNYSTNSMWSMVQFGDWLIVTNGTDTVQYIDVTAPTHFDDLSADAPTAKLVGALGDFVMLSNIGTNQRGIQWSGLNQPTFWTPRQRSADFQTFPDGGEIIAYTGGVDGCLIFSAESIRVGQLALDTSLVMTFKQTITNHGCMGPRAAVATGHGVFYLSDDGFYMYGTPPVKIGDERVDNTFLDDIDRQELYNVWGSEDPNRKIVYWAYKSKGNTVANTYDKVLLYHYGINKWSLLSPGRILTGLVDATTPGFTLDSLATLGIPLDQLPYPLDSRAWSGGTPAIAAFDEAYRLGFFAGAPLQAVLQTGDAELTTGKRSFVRGFRPLGDSPAISGRVAVKDWSGQPRTFQQPFDVHQRTGMIPARASGRFHRFEITIPAGETWTAVHGIEPLGGAEGEQ